MVGLWRLAGGLCRVRVGHVPRLGGRRGGGRRGVGRRGGDIDQGHAGQGVEAEGAEAEEAQDRPRGGRQASEADQGRLLRHHARGLLCEVSLFYIDL